MAEEEVTTNPMEQDYLAEIEKMKESMVSKNDYDKMKEENRRLLNSIVNGQKEDKPAEVVDIQACRRALFDPNSSNLTIAENALKLRNELIRTGGRDADPFVPHGSQIAPTEEDYASAQRVADGLASCIEYANGDRDVFTNELQRITRDVRVRR
jgi:hypothetical protein